MKEELLHYLWNSKALVAYPLHSSLMEKIRIVHPGIYNRDQGPDFLFARIEINDVLWVGHIELHIRSSDWYKHSHQSDPNYQNIILHVVWENDVKVHLHERILTCIELRTIIPIDFLNQYSSLMASIQPVACRNFLDKVDPILKTNQMESLMVERMQFKTDQIFTALEAHQFDWEELMYRKIAHYLVAPVNSKAMESLCEQVPLDLIRKLCHDVSLVEACLFGVAGFLNKSEKDEYHRGLRKEFSFLKQKFKLNEIPVFNWKFLRMRPVHFPTIRLAQWSALLHTHPRIFSHLLEANSIGELMKLFEIKTSHYWEEHYHFKKTKRKALLGIGQHTRQTIIINAVCPIMFAYGRMNSRPELCNKAIKFLTLMKYESNTISRMWKNLNFAMDHAGHSQAGIQLFHEYCVQKKCTQCQIGHSILKQSLNQIQDQAQSADSSF